MNDLNKISIFKNYFDPIPAVECSVRDFCLNVQNGDYSEEITALRKETLKKQRDAIKATWPACTISGTFSKRNKQNLIQHSGFICIDIDQHDNSEINDWPALRDSLSSIQNIYFAALSASGKGIFLIIPISTPDKHENQFTALEMDFKAIGLTIDKACKDVSRLRGISFDPDAVINNKAETYKRIYQPPQPKQYDHKPATTDQKVMNAKKWMDRNFIFTIGNRHNYIKQFAGVLHRFGVDELTARNELFAYVQPDFKESEIQHIVQYMYSNTQYNNCVL
jgi:hypothetical protein